jgi:hypothetical protein
MVEEDSSGYRYNDENTKSLAGCINSVHDLMGMVIMEEAPKDGKDADDVSIYYDSKGDKLFKRKHTTYEYIDISNAEEIENNKIEKDANLLIYYEPKNEGLLLYEKENYYLKDGLNNYWREDNNEPDESRNYYTLTPKSVPLEEKYKKDTWWYKDSNDNYIKAVEEDSINNKQYVIPTFEENKIFTWYKPGSYFYSTTKPEDGNPESVTIRWTKIAVGENEFNDIKYNSSYTYWGIDGVDIGT